MYHSEGLEMLRREIGPAVVAHRVVVHLTMPPYRSIYPYYRDVWITTCTYMPSYKIGITPTPERKSLTFQSHLLECIKDDDPHR